MLPRRIDKERLALAAILAVLVLLPYLVAFRLAPPGTSFGGFLLNPVDGYSYLAKMRQGAAGSWSFTLPYAPEPGSGAYLFLYQLALGRLAGWFSLPLLSVYHAARLVGALLVAWSAWAFFERLLPNAAAVRRAAVLALFGSGLGYLLLPAGIVAPDLNVPEAIPFVSALANAHFPLALAAMLWLARLCLQPWRRATPGAWVPPLVLGALLAILQPFAVGVLAAMLAGAGPFLLYDLYIVRTHPMLRAWNAQNLTPSPPAWHFAFALGLPLLLALWAMLRPATRKRWPVRLLALWVLLQGVLIYVPFPLQRRLALGIFFPLVGLAAYGLKDLPQRAPRLARWVWIAVMLFSLPSNLLVVAAGLSRVAAGDPALVLSEPEVEAYKWMAENIAPGALVLAGPRAGNRIPAYAPLRVLYGHPFETPQAQEALERVQALYGWRGAAGDGLDRLQQLGIDYVVYGPEEAELGAPSWLSELEAVFESDGVLVYQVGAP